MLKKKNTKIYLDFYTIEVGSWGIQTNFFQIIRKF